MDRQTVCLSVHLNTTIRVRSKGVHVQDCPVSCTCSAFTPNGFGHWRSLISPCCLFICVVLQPTRKRRFAPRCRAAHTRVRVCIHVVLQPTHMCRFAAMLSCSPHACAGLHLRRLAAYTRVQVCNLVVMQPTRECGFASTLPCISYIATTPSCSLHASAGLQPCCHAAHTQVRVCIHVALQLVRCNHTILQPTRKCRFAILLSCCPHTSAGLHPFCLASHTQVRVSKLVVTRSTSKCGLALTLSCSPHACAGVQPSCHAAHTQVRVCIHVALQPTCRCGVATRRSCSPHAVQVCTAAVMYENSSYHMPKHL